MSEIRDCRPRNEASCSDTRVDSVVVVESLMSRRRCSTPISSASSASIAVGTCRNVFRVSVPSYKALCEYSVSSFEKISVRTSLTFFVAPVTDHSHSLRRLSLSRRLDPSALVLERSLLQARAALERYESRPGWPLPVYLYRDERFA